MRIFLILMLISHITFADTLVQDGATCDIPEGYNSAPHSSDFNSRGMGEFCVFPAKPWVDAFQDYFDSCTEPTLPAMPECASGLVVSPSVQTFPCYEVREE